MGASQCGASGSGDPSYRARDHLMRLAFSNYLIGCYRDYYTLCMLSFQGKIVVNFHGKGWQGVRIQILDMARGEMV